MPIKPKPNPLDPDIEPESPPDSGHHSPPLGILTLWVLFFIYLVYYLYKYMLPDLLQWLK
jgi:hypothetical protein